MQSSCSPLQGAKINHNHFDLGMKKGGQLLKKGRAGVLCPKGGGKLINRVLEGVKNQGGPADNTQWASARIVLGEEPCGVERVMSLGMLGKEPTFLGPKKKGAQL